MKMVSILNKRSVRALLLLGALVLLATMVDPPPPPPEPGAAFASVTATPVALDAADPARSRAGQLVFLRGWDLNSEEPRFGGISAMQVEGERVTAISDAGVLFAFPLPRRPGRLPLQLRPLDPSGDEGDKGSRDTESMLFFGGSAWFGLERQNAVIRYRRSDWRRESDAQPRAMRDWRGNSGPEAMVRLRDGRFLVFSEGRDDGAAFSDVVLFAGDPADPATSATRLRYRRLPAFRVTDAALLPDGRVLVLNRRFTLLEGVAAKLAVVEIAGLGEGATLEPRGIADLRPPLTVDNMEALSVAQEGGRTIVRIASDDNFMALQRTLLLEFELRE
ncbi:MAG TPA: esterase-like activity of phytase family protein [Allosphingosinicella sp.]|jgi:hypothetical protein|nr:esterase-like activity of phytase family protein [Allosphingosinicella sp.]